MTVDPNAYPAHEEEVTADHMARYLTDAANRRHNLIIAAGDDVDEKYLAHISAMLGHFSLAYLLRYLPAEGHKEMADQFAREIWRAWEDGSTPGELLWEWCEEYGLDPEAGKPEPATT